MSDHNKRISLPPAQTESSSSTRRLSDSSSQYGTLEKKRTVLKDNSWIKHKPEDSSNDENYGKVVLNHYKNGDEIDSFTDPPSPEKTNPFSPLKKTPKSNKDEIFGKPVPGQVKPEGTDRTMTAKTSDPPKVTIFSSDQNGPYNMSPSSPVQSKTSVTTRYGPEGDTVITTTTKTSQVKSSTKPGYDRSSSKEDMENITNIIKTTTMDDKPKSVTTVRTNNVTIDDDWPDSSWNSTKDSTIETRTYITKKTTISEDKPKTVTTVKTSSISDTRKPDNEPPIPPKRTSSSQEFSNGGFDFETQPSYTEKSDFSSPKSISDYDYGKQSSYTVKTDTYSPKSSVDYDYDFGRSSSYSGKSSTLSPRSSVDFDYDYGRPSSYSTKSSTLPTRSSLDYDYDIGRQSSYTVKTDSFSPRSSRSIDSYYDSTDGPTSQTFSYTYETRSSPRTSNSYYDSVDGPSSKPTTYTYETKTSSSTPSLDMYDMMSSKTMTSVYAGNDRATSDKDFCTYCNKPFNQEPKMILEHMNISCHASCFKCGVCNAPLGSMVAGDSLWTYKQTVYCERCYNNQKAKWAY